MDGRLVGVVEWPSQKDWESQNLKKTDLSLQKAMMEAVDEVESLFAMETLEVISPLS